MGGGGYLRFHGFIEGMNDAHEDVIKLSSEPVGCHVSQSSPEVERMWSNVSGNEFQGLLPDDCMLGWLMSLDECAAEGGVAQSARVWVLFPLMFGKLLLTAENAARTLWTNVHVGYLTKLHIRQLKFMGMVLLEVSNKVVLVLNTSAFAMWIFADLA